MKDTWERNSSGDLIPHSAKVNVGDSVLEKAITLQKVKLDQVTDENKKAIMQRAVHLLEDALKEKSTTLSILYTPLLDCEIRAISRGLGLDGIRIQDIEAEVCSKHCLDPIRSYAEWRDMKDPREKQTIAAFIVENSIPKSEKSQKEKEGFQILQGMMVEQILSERLTRDTGRTGMDIHTSRSED